MIVLNRDSRSGSKSNVPNRVGGEPGDERIGDHRGQTFGTGDGGVDAVAIKNKPRTKPSTCPQSH